MAQSWVSLANVTLAATTSTVSFSSISQAYSDLILVAGLKTDSNNYPTIRFNGVSTGFYKYSNSWANYNQKNYNNDTVATAFTFVGQVANAATTSSDIYELQVLNYSSSSTYKMTFERRAKADNSTTTNSHTGWGAGLFPSTSPVTSITFSAGANVFAIGSTFVLYGIAA